MLTALDDCPIPTIAAVNGVAAGAGANLALACDVVIAARSAVFVQAFARIGLIPDAGGTWWLPRQVGFARAMGAALFAEPVTADEAAAWGMIWQAVPDADFAATVAERARDRSPTARPSPTGWPSRRCARASATTCRRSWRSRPGCRARPAQPATSPRASPPSSPSARPASRAAECRERSPTASSAPRGRTTPGSRPRPPTASPPSPSRSARSSPAPPAARPSSPA